MAAVAEKEPIRVERRGNATDRVTSITDARGITEKKKVSGTIFLMNEKSRERLEKKRGEATLILASCFRRRWL